MISMDEIKERVILVAVDTDGSDQAERSLDELGELAKTAGAEVVGRMIQPRETIHPGTYIGKGKILELKELLWETHGTGIICDDELTSVQMGNLEAELDCKIMDRTLLILDIFAARSMQQTRLSSPRTRRLFPLSFLVIQKAGVDTDVLS